MKKISKLFILCFTAMLSLFLFVSCGISEPNEVISKEDAQEIYIANEQNTKPNYTTISLSYKFDYDAKDDDYESSFELIESGIKIICSNKYTLSDYTYGTLSQFASIAPLELSSSYIAKYADFYKENGGVVVLVKTNSLGIDSKDYFYYDENNYLCRLLEVYESVYGSYTLELNFDLS